MPKHWLYVPLPTHDDSVIRTMERRYSEKYGERQVLHSNVHAPGTDQEWEYITKGFIGVYKPLKKVRNGDILLIAAHGSNTDDRVSMKTGTRVNGVTTYTTTSSVDRTRVTTKQMPKMVDVHTLLTPNDLADLIRMDGLSDSHRLIKLNSCFACGALSPDPYTCSDPFAKLLAVALGQLKYKKVVVGGYSGTVQFNHVFPSTPKTVSTLAGGEPQPARGTRRYFDATGAEVTV